MKFNVKLKAESYKISIASKSEFILSMNSEVPLILKKI